MWADDLVGTVREIMDSDVGVKDFWGIPHVNQVPKGNEALEFPACVLTIDLRGSTSILDEHHRPTAVKIYKAFHEVACRVVEKYGGRVRSFDGDGVLALWHAESSEEIQQATLAAIVLKDLLRGGAGAAMRKYRDVDFGIGLDHGTVHAARVGSGSDSATRDLVWLGHAVTFSVRLADNAKAPKSLWVSDKIYQYIPDKWKFKNPDGFLFRGSKWAEKETSYEGEYITVHRLEDKYRMLRN